MPSAYQVPSLDFSSFLSSATSCSSIAPSERNALRLTARQSMRSCFYLATISQKQGRTLEARRYQERAMSVVASDPELRREFEQFSQPR